MISSNINKNKKMVVNLPQISLKLATIIDVNVVRVSGFPPLHRGLACFIYGTYTLNIQHSSGMWAKHMTEQK